MPKYNDLSKELQEKIEQDRANHVVNPYAFRNEDALRRKMDWDKNKLLRPAFVRDCEKILHLPMYNRYADKTRYFHYTEMMIFQGVQSCAVGIKNSQKHWWVAGAEYGFNRSYFIRT